jgi:hypothetical protein
VIALFGMAAIPGTSGAVQPFGSPSLHVSVRPASGSSTTHFRVLILSCPPGTACPAIVPLPRMVGKFTLRVRRG